MWVKIFLKHEEGNFISTQEIFNAYDEFSSSQNCLDARVLNQPFTNKFI
jgi:hypothetical protein